MLLLLIGMKTDLKLARKSGFAAMMIEAWAIAVPFAFGFLLGQFGSSQMLKPPMPYFFGNTASASLKNAAAPR
jgi:Kef-type K+ transport system membrane component KefB